MKEKKLKWGKLRGSEPSTVKFYVLVQIIKKWKVIRII